MLSDPITLIFSFIIAAIFILVVLYILFPQGIIGQLGKKRIFSAPTLLTSIGILGTFVGIIYSLLDFNTAQLDASIPRLLEGMKIAFFTSVIGIASSILLKIILLLTGQEDENKETEFATNHIERQTRNLEETIPLLLQRVVDVSE